MKKILISCVMSLFLLSCSSKESKLSNLETEQNLEKLNNYELQAIIDNEKNNKLMGSIKKKTNDRYLAKKAQTILDLRKSHKLNNPKLIFKKAPITSKNIYNYPSQRNLNDNIKKNTISITSYDTITNLESKSSYDAYYYANGPKIRIVCEQPCKIPEEILKKKIKGARNAIENLLELTKIDVLSDLQPVDIHLTSDTECGNYEKLFNENGYVSRSSAGRPEWTGGSFMCLWEFDDKNLVLPLDEDNAEKLEAQSVLVHEYSHILFYRRSFASPEEFVKSLQFYVSGLWDGNGLETKNFPLIIDACDPNEKEFAKDIYNLCNKCGFQMDKFGTLLSKINFQYQKGKGEEDTGEKKGKVSIPQMKKIIDEITGKDSVKDCDVSWLAEPCYNCSKTP